MFGSENMKDKTMFTKFCYICLCKDIKLFDYNKFDLKLYYEQLMGKKLKKPVAGVPQYFCYQCAALLYKFHGFKMRCIYGEQVLRELLLNGPVTSKSIQEVDRKKKQLESPIGYFTEDCKVHIIDYEFTPQLVSLEHSSTNLKQSKRKSSVQMGKSTNKKVKTEVNDNFDNNESLMSGESHNSTMSKSELEINFEIEQLKAEKGQIEQLKVQKKNKVINNFDTKKSKAIKLEMSENEMEIDNDNLESNEFDRKRLKGGKSKDKKEIKTKKKVEVSNSAKTKKKKLGENDNNSTNKPIVSNIIDNKKLEADSTNKRKKEKIKNKNGKTNDYDNISNKTIKTGPTDDHAINNFDNENISNENDKNKTLVYVNEVLNSDTGDMDVVIRVVDSETTDNKVNKLNPKVTREKGSKMNKGTKRKSKVDNSDKDFPFSDNDDSITNTADNNNDKSDIETEVIEDNEKPEYLEILNTEENDTDDIEMLDTEKNFSEEYLEMFKTECNEEYLDIGNETEEYLETDTEINDTEEYLDTCKEGNIKVEYLEIFNEDNETEEYLDDETEYLDMEDFENFDKRSKKGTKKKKKRDKMLQLEHWSRITMNEEQAVENFKARALEPKYVDATYKCKLCYTAYSKEDMLVRHTRLLHCESRGSHICHICQRRFRNKGLLTYHRLMHYNKYKCLRCNQILQNDKSAMRHNQFHSGYIKECKICKLQFRHQTTYYNHIRTNHRSEYVCDICGYSFKGESGLRLHKHLKHIDQDMSLLNAADSTYCKKCDINFLTVEGYEKHFRHSAKHADENKKHCALKLKFRDVNPHVTKTCTICDITFPNCYQFKNHHRKEHKGIPMPSDILVCHICGITLKHSTIATHMKVHTKKDLFPCEICGAQFTNKYNVERHAMKHSVREKSVKYKCPVCHKIYSNKGNMVAHYRSIHLNERRGKKQRADKNNEDEKTSE